MLICIVGVFLSPNQMTSTTKLPFGIWCWNCSNLAHCQTPQCFCDVIFLWTWTKIRPIPNIQNCNWICVFCLWSFVFNELIYFTPHYQMPSRMKSSWMHYNNSWLFKRFNLTKVLAIIKGCLLWLKAWDMKNIWFFWMIFLILKWPFWPSVKSYI